MKRTGPLQLKQTNAHNTTHEKGKSRQMAPSQAIYGCRLQANLVLGHGALTAYECYLYYHTTAPLVTTGLLPRTNNAPQLIKTTYRPANKAARGKKTKQHKHTNLQPPADDAIS